MFPNSQVVITGGSFNNFHGRRGMDRLEEAAVPGAFHNSLERQDPPKCHKHTREAILKKIMDWVTKKIDTDTFILWLYGAAGAGKSAIAQTIAELCDEHNFLLASFFFFRSDSFRSNSKRLVATIAYQITVVIPGARELMEVVLNKDPHILSRSLTTQFMTLIVNPLEHLLEISVGEPMALPNLIIIDGLDECMDGTQVQILDMVFAIGKRSKFPFIFLVASRPEQGISTALGNGRIREGLTRLPLDTDYTSFDDIEHFLQDKLDEVRLTHPLRSDIPSLWPSSKDIKTLANKSSGQFIYASTVVKFVSSHRHRPTHRLEIILGLRPVDKDLPFAELDALYRYVLLFVKDTTAAVQIIAINFTLGYPYNIKVLAGILDTTPSDIKLCLIDLTSLVEFKPTTLIILHATLGDFLFNEARSRELYTNPRSIHTKITQRLLRDPNLSSNWDLDCYWGYSWDNLEYHCSKAELTLDLKADICHFPVRQILSTNLYQICIHTAVFMNFAKSIRSLDIEGADLISTRYISEHDEALISVLNSFPSFVIDSLVVLCSSKAYTSVHSPPTTRTTADAILVLHMLIFHLVCDKSQKSALRRFVFAFFHSEFDDEVKDKFDTQLPDFFSDPQRSQHHTVDQGTHNSVTERCFSYIFNHWPTHFLAIRRWASKSKGRPWLKRRKPKCVITNSMFKRQKYFPKEFDLERDKRLQPFWALSLALKYIPYLLNNATKSVELLALAKIWSCQRWYPLSLFRRDTNKAERAVDYYLERCGVFSATDEVSGNLGQNQLACLPPLPHPYPQFQDYHPQHRRRTLLPTVPSPPFPPQILPTYTSIPGAFGTAPLPPLLVDPPHAIQTVQYMDYEQTYSYNQPSMHMSYSLMQQPSQPPPSFHSGYQPTSWTALYTVGADPWTVDSTAPSLYPQHLQTRCGICVEANFEARPGSSLTGQAGSFVTDRHDSEGGILPGGGSGIGWNWEGESIGSDLLPDASNISGWHGEDAGGIGSGLLHANVSSITERPWEDGSGIGSNLPSPNNPLKRKFGESTN